MSELNTAKANLASAQSSLNYQSANMSRYQPLYKKGLVSADDYENALLTYRQAKEQVASAKENVQKAQTNLSYATITSPIDGTVISKSVEEGQTVAASFNTPELFTIAKDLTNMQVIANVDEADIGGVKEGDRVNFTVDAYPDDVFQGTVKQVRLEATTTNNVVTYEVVISGNVKCRMLNYLASNSKRSFHLTFNITTSKMNYQNLFKIAIRAIAANKMRSFLTALGFIIGIAAVITMLAIGQGSKASIKANIAEMGSNMIMISPGADMRGGVRQDASSMETLKQADYQSIKDECNYISAISPTVNSSGQWIYGNNNTQSSIYGVNQDYLSIRQLKVADGEMFTDTDIKAASKVCILGQTVVDYLFPDGSDPIGKVVRFNSIPFRVIGVLKKKGYNSMGMEQDDLVLAPYTTVMKRIMAQTYLGGIVCSAITEEASQPAQDQITEILRRNHKLKDATDTTEADEDDFNIRSQEEISSMMNSTMSTITILLGSVAGISLLVGGIGIMNIMYVSVTERTREIGLRMSVGARGIDILNQFLIKAILLSVTGGIIGVILGVSLSLSLNYFFHIATQIEPWSIIMSFAVCTFTGVFFGWYPAKKAARLDPIEAIRYE